MRTLSFFSWKIGKNFNKKEPTAQYKKRSYRHWEVWRMILHSCSLKQMAQCSSLMYYWCFCTVNCLRIRTRSSFWGHSNFGFVAFSLFSKHSGSNFCHTPPSSSALFICNILLSLLLIKKHDFRMDSPGYSKKNPPHLKDCHINLITLTLSGCNIK